MVGFFGTRLSWGAIALALASAPLGAKPAPVDSWGRAGVDYETYRKDALECGVMGYTADISQTRQAKDFVTASRELQAVDDANYVSPSASPTEAAYQMAGQAQHYEQIRQSIRPDKEMRELKQGMVGVVESCLVQRGYVKFRLTDDQRRALARLKHGSDERRQFLHALASDPAVLGAQALPRSA